RRSRADARRRGTGSRSPPRFLDRGSVVPPLGRLVAPPLEPDRDPRCGLCRYPAGWLAALARVAPAGRARQSRRNPYARGRRRTLPRLRPRRRTTHGRETRSVLLAGHASCFSSRVRQETLAALMARALR